MQMTSGEIITSYKQAKNPGEQIKILAELNDTTIDAITDILAGAGVTIPSQGKTRIQLFDERADKIIISGSKDGLNAEQIAKKIGMVTAKQVRSRMSYLRKLGKLPTTTAPAATVSKITVPQCIIDFAQSKLAELQAQIDTMQSEAATLKAFLEVVK